MQRRSNAISGCVNFPVDSTTFKSSDEGGMLVKLVVCDNRDDDWSNRFGVCCGADVYDLLTEVLTGDDRRPNPVAPETFDSVEAVDAEQKAQHEWSAYHYPHANDDSAPADIRYVSRCYLASVLLGSSGWSGWNDAKGEYWKCTFEALNPQGQALYRLMESLYPGCDVHLLTFLDT